MSSDGRERPVHCSALILGLALIACPPPPGAARLEPGDGEANGPVSLALGESAEIGGLKVTFTGVDGDNRCPKTVQCFVAGEAGVLLAVADAAGGSAELRVAVPPDGAASGRYQDYEITVDLEPETDDTEPIDPKSYVATVTVSRSSDAA